MAKPPLTPPDLGSACMRPLACMQACSTACNTFSINNPPLSPQKFAYQDDIYEINIVLLILLTPLGANLPGFSDAVCLIGLPRGVSIEVIILLN
jgi:hypothetical protein